MDYFDKLDLSLVDHNCHDSVIKDFQNSDPKAMLCNLPNEYGLRFVSDNFEPLFYASIYEKALLFAFTGCKSNWSKWPLTTIKFHFNLADKNRLLAAGDELPGDGPYILFRGVAGDKRKKRIRGISWTSSFDKAKWFAERFGSIHNDPEVYCAKVKRKFVYAYYNGREEQEFLCNIPKHLKLEKVWPE